MMKYTADQFNRDIQRIFLAANISHIWVDFKDAHGSSGAMLAFGPSKDSIYYFIETTVEDRYKTYYVRTVPEMIKEIRKDFFKYQQLFPKLSLVAHPDLLSNRAYDKVVDKQISHFLRRLIKYNIAYRDFKSFAVGAELFFKKQETLNKKKLFDLLVTKGKLGMDHFSKYFGPMDEEGEDISERVKHFKHGNWDIYLDVKTKRGIDEVIQLLDDSSKDLARRGYSKLCYGKVFMVDNLGGKILADYNEKNDTMRIGFKMLKKSNSQNQKTAFIHEIGHRNYFKFLNPSQRGENKIRYIKESKFSSKENPHSGDTLVGMRSGDKWKVENTQYKRNLKYVVQLIELGENTKLKTKDLNQKFLIDDKFIGVDFIVEGHGDSVNTFFPRPYGLVDEYEFYAVLWESWFQNKLKDPAKTWFEGIEK